MPSLAKNGLLVYTDHNGNKFARVAWDSDPFFALEEIAATSRDRYIVTIRPPRRIRRRGGTHFQVYRIMSDVQELLDLVRRLIFEILGKISRISLKGPKRAIILTT